MLAAPSAPADDAAGGSAAAASAADKGVEAVDAAAGEAVAAAGEAVAGEAAAGEAAAGAAAADDRKRAAGADAPDSAEPSYLCGWDKEVLGAWRQVVAAGAKRRRSLGRKEFTKKIIVPPLSTPDMNVVAVWPDGYEWLVVDVTVRKWMEMKDQQLDYVQMSALSFNVSCIVCVESC